MIEKIKGKFSENTWNATIVGIVIFCLFAFRRADTYINNYIGKLSFFNSSQNVSLVYLNKLLIALISYLPFTFFTFLILGLMLLFTAGKHKLIQLSIEIYNRYKTKYFLFLLLEGFFGVIILCYSVILFPMQKSIKIDLVNYQLTSSWMKESGCLNVFYFIGIFIFAFIEETIYRVVIYHVFSSVTFRVFSAILTSTLFAFYHDYSIYNGIFIIRNIITSLFLIYALEKTKSIWWSVGAHFGLNAFLFDVVTTVEEQKKLAIAIIFVFLLYMVLDYLIIKYFKRREVDNTITKRLQSL